MHPKVKTSQIGYIQSWESHLACRLVKMIVDAQNCLLIMNYCKTTSKKQKNWQSLLFSSENLPEKVRKSRRQNSAEKCVHKNVVKVETK